MDVALGLKPVQRWRLQIPKLQDKAERSFLRLMKLSNNRKEFLDSKQAALESVFFDDELKISEDDLKKLDDEVAEIMKNRKKIKKDSPNTPAKSEETQNAEAVDDTKSKEKHIKQEEEAAVSTSAPTTEIKKEEDISEGQKKLIEDLQAKLNELKSQKSKSFILLKTIIDEDKLKKEKKALKQQQMYSNDPKSPLSASLPPPSPNMGSPLLAHYQNVPTSGLAPLPHGQPIHMQQQQQIHGMHPQPPPPPLQIPPNLSNPAATLIPSGNEMISQHQMIHSASQGSLSTPPSAGTGANTPSSAHYHRDHHYHQPYTGQYSHSLPPYNHTNYHHPSSNIYHAQSNSVPSPSGVQQGLLHTPSVSAQPPTSTLMDSHNPNSSGRNVQPGHPPAPMPTHSGFDSPYGVAPPPIQGSGMHHAPFPHFSRHGLPPPPPPNYHNELPPQHHHHHSYHPPPPPYHAPPPRGQNYYQPYGAPPRFVDRGGHSRPPHQRNWR